MNVKTKVQERRSPVSSTAEHRIKANRFLDGLDEVVQWMSSAVLSMLAESLDDINANNIELRAGMNKCLRRLLSMTAQKQERVVFFHEAIPGFTVLAVKKEGWGETTAPARAPTTKKAGPPAPVPAASLDQARDEAVQAVIAAYVGRTGNRVLAIEGTDVVLVLFPVADLKRNLQEMGFFWSD